MPPLPPSGWPISSPLLALSKYCLTESHWGEEKVFCFCCSTGCMEGILMAKELFQFLLQQHHILL